MGLPETLEGPGLDRVAIEIAQGWIKRVLDKLIEQDRSLEGGWPGTVTEARQISIEWVRSQADATSGPGITRDQLERLARAVYDGAKQEWLADNRTGTIRRR